MSYRIDHEAVRAYAREIGVTENLEIIRSARSTYLGQHEYTLFGGHRITLDSQQDAVTCADTIGHELCHALQAERAGSFREWETICKVQHRLPHPQRPIEVEAFAFGAEHAEEIFERCLKVRT